jgi:uncharacterized protein (DUF1501 family)
MPTKPKVTRRQFMMGCSVAIAAMAGARLTHLAFADPEAMPAAGYNDEILVAVFCAAAGMRSTSSRRWPGRTAAITKKHGWRSKCRWAHWLHLNAQFGMNSALAPLFNLYQAGHLAVVHAVGLTEDTRSHFDAMQYIELGTPGVKTTANGWITRHLQSAPNLPPTIFLPALSAGSGQAESLLGSSEAAAMSDPNSFSIGGHWRWGDPQRAALRAMYTGDNWLFGAGTQTLNTLDVIQAAGVGHYNPSNGAVYPGGSFGDNLQTIAQLIKANLGLRAASIDLGGWDTHEYEGDGGGGYLANNQLGPLGQGLAAFYADLSNAACASDFTHKLTGVVMSEFGRRLRENANHGTDHGHGNVMFVLGGNVNGGQVYGNWPGLANNQLYQSTDLAVTTDYRRVLSEIVTKRLGNPNLSAVFPGYAGYTSMNILKGGTVTVPPPLGAHNIFLPEVSAGGACS